MSGHHAVIPKGAKNTLSFLVGVLVLAYIYQVQVSGVADIGLPTKTINTIGVFYNVTKVVDGDTIDIEMGGRNERVRLIGINTPEIVDPRTSVQCFGKEATERMKELVDGKIVRLEYDTTQGLRDAYGRLLAYVYLEDKQMVNRKLVAEGYAYEYTYMKPYKYQKEFRQLQTLARTSERGLWSENTCGGNNKLSQ